MDDSSAKAANKIYNDMVDNANRRLHPPMQTQWRHGAILDREKIEAGARLILEGLRVDLSDHNFADTPQRVADVYEEIFTPAPTKWSVFDESYTDIVIIRHHEFATFCPHHLLPVTFKAAVAYFPNGKVIGASKLIRLIAEVNTEPRTQEKLTALIVNSIKLHTMGTSQGEAVLLEGSHECFSLRGVKSDASMATMKFTGRFEEEPEWQRRFLDLAK